MVGLACGVRSTGAESRRRREPRVVAAKRVRVVAPVRVATDSVHGTCRNVWPVVSPRSPQTRAANHGRVRLTAWDPRPRALAESLMRQHVDAPPGGRGVRRWPQALRGEARRALRGSAGIGFASLGLAARGESPDGIRPAMHPRWRRCSSLNYTRYSQSSRLAIGAPRRSRCSPGLSPRAVRLVLAGLCGRR